MGGDPLFFCAPWSTSGITRRDLLGDTQAVIVRGDRRTRRTKLVCRTWCAPPTAAINRSLSGRSRLVARHSKEEYVTESLSVMMHMAARIEADINRKGWDQEPMFTLLFRSEINESRMIISAAPYPVQPTDVDPNPAVGLSKIIHWLDHEGSEFPVVPPDIGTDFYGFAFSAEAWHSELSPEERQGRRLADIPGSKEARVVQIITPEGNFIFVERLRGEQPIMTVLGPGGIEPELIDGNLPVAMRDMMLMVGRKIPFAGVDMAAVARIGSGK